jgi:hypothetical protein
LRAWRKRALAGSAERLSRLVAKVACEREGTRLRGGTVRAQARLEVVRHGVDVRLRARQRTASALAQQETTGECARAQHRSACAATRHSGAELQLGALQAEPLQRV